MGSLDVPNHHLQNGRSDSIFSMGKSPLPPSAYKSGSSRFTSCSSLGSARLSINSLTSLLPNRPELEIEFVDGLDEKHECPVCCQVCGELLVIVLFFKSVSFCQDKDLYFHLF